MNCIKPIIWSKGGKNIKYNLIIYDFLDYGTTFVVRYSNEHNSYNS